MNLHFQSNDSQTKRSDELFWPQLKLAISTTSGFHRWANELGLNPKAKGSDLDALIHTYLRQTLETLAY